MGGEGGGGALGVLGFDARFEIHQSKIQDLEQSEASTLSRFANGEHSG